MNHACFEADSWPVILQAFNDASLETIRQESAAVKTLCGKGVSDIDILGPDAPRPAGCVTFAVSSELAVFVYVKGRVDMDAEIEKASRKLEKVSSMIDKQKKINADPQYLERVAQPVQELDMRRIRDMESEARGLEGTIKQFEQLRLE